MNACNASEIKYGGCFMLLVRIVFFQHDVNDNVNAVMYTSQDLSELVILPNGMCFH